jgi:hypothetical protein
MRVCVNVFDCTVFRKKKKRVSTFIRRSVVLNVFVLLLGLSGDPNTSMVGGPHLPMTQHVPCARSFSISSGMRAGSQRINGTRQC